MGKVKLMHYVFFQQLRYFNFSFSCRFCFLFFTDQKLKNTVAHICAYLFSIRAFRKCERTFESSSANLTPAVLFILFTLLFFPLAAYLKHSFFKLDLKIF